MAPSSLLNSPNLRRLLPVTAVFGVLLLVGVLVYWPAGEKALSDEELVEQALTSSVEVAKNQAAATLIARQRNSRGQVRRLYETSEDPVVRATCIQGMGRLYDYQSMDELLDAMEDPSSLVRARANAAVVRMIGLDGHFDPNGPLEDRERIIAFYRLQWDKMRGSGALAEFEQTVEVRYGEGTR